MSDWANVRLGDLIDIKHGFAFRGEFFVPEPPGDLLLTPGNFAIGGGFQWGKPKYYRGPVPEDYVLKPGDLIVTMTDLSKEADTLGYSAIVPTHETRLLHNQRIGKIVARSDRAYPLFLYWIMRTKKYRNEILASVTGSTVKHTSPSKILAFQFALPTLGEQRAIVSILGALDDKIDLNRRMNDTLEAMARAFFQDWFVTFGPTRAKRDGRLPYLAPDLWSLFPNRLDDDGKPEGWSTTSLVHLTSKIGSGATPTGGSQVYVTFGTALIRSQNVYDNGFSWGGLAWITDEHATRLNGVTVQPDDVLINITGDSILRCCVVDPDVLPARVNQHVAIIRAAGKIPHLYLHQYLVLPQTKERLIGYDAGGSRAAITKAHLESLPVLLPNEKVLAAFADKTKPLLDRVSANNRENRTLAATRDLLLPKLMSGELRVRDAERVAETVL
jgi:type I restriction enzyme S subunit